MATRKKPKARAKAKTKRRAGKAKGRSVPNARKQRRAVKAKVASKKLVAKPGQIYVVRPTQKKAISQVFHVVEKLNNGNERRFKVEEQYRWGQGYLTSEDILPSGGQSAVKCQINTDHLDTNLDDGVATFFDFDDACSEMERNEIETGWNGEAEGNSSCSEVWLFQGDHTFNFDVEDAYIEIYSGMLEVDIVDGKSGRLIAKNIPLRAE